VEAELINADEEMGRQTGGHEDVASLVAFHNFTNAPEKANMLFEWLSSSTIFEQQASRRRLVLISNLVTA